MRKKIIFSLMLLLASLFGAAQCELNANFEYVLSDNQNWVELWAINNECPQTDSISYQWNINGVWAASGVETFAWLNSQGGWVNICLIVRAWQDGVILQAEDHCEEVFVESCNIGAQFATIAQTPNQVSFQVVEVWGGTPPYSYVWTGNNAVGSTTTESTVVFEAPIYPFYGVVQITDANGCFGVFTVVAQGPPAACVANIEYTQEGYGFYFNAAGAGAGNSVSWSLNGLTVGSWNQIWLDLTPGVNIITLQVFNTQTGCSETDTVEIVVPEPITICGYAFADTNENGVMDDGEEGVEGVSFYAYPDSTWTDENGFYEIEVYPGDFWIVGNSSLTGYTFIDGVEFTYHQLQGNALENMTDCNFNWPMEDHTATVCGTTYLDANQNGVWDDNESVLPGAQIVFYTWGSGEFVEDVVAYSNENGEYCITAPIGWGSFTGIYSTANAETLSVVLQIPNGLEPGTAVDNANIGFYFVENAIEVSVNVSSWNTATPGFYGTYIISLENAGTLSAITDVTLNFPSSQTILDIPVLGGVQGVLDAGANTITWSGVEVHGFEIMTAYVGIVNSVSTPLGSIVNIVAGAFVTNGTDVYLTNNTSALAQTVVGSYDPNNKLNQPEGIGSQGEMAPTNDPFTYTINFQNTGTAPAFTVRVEDQLDSDLDWSSFEMITSSHDYIVQMADGKLVWTFNNIMLPDSTTNEPESHGHIVYRIKPIADKPLGTVFENTAYIYFDFNEPIITNTTVNTFAVVQSVSENETNQNVRIYPNPTSGEFTIVSEALTGDARVSIYDVAGREVYSQNSTSIGSVLLTQKMEPGHYLVRINNARSNQTVKLIVR